MWRWSPFILWNMHIIAIRPIGDHPPIQSIGLYHPLRNVRFNLFEMFAWISDHGMRRYNALLWIFPDHSRQRRCIRLGLFNKVLFARRQIVKLSRCNNRQLYGVKEKFIGVVFNYKCKFEFSCKFYLSYTTTAQKFEASHNSQTKSCFSYRHNCFINIDIHITHTTWV